MTLVPGPGSLAVLGAGLFQEPTVESPLPGGVATVVRVLLNLPAWFQAAGFLVGVLAALTAAWYLWRRRVTLVAWVKHQPERSQLWLAAAAGTVLLVGAGFGGLSWNYMQHDNGFCTGCHVMGPAYARFAESKHSTLSCHDCHEQSLFASMRQLYLWVAERPVEIGPHAKVANAVCARCHVTDQPQVWQHIAATAGHRTHLESKAAALEGVQCVTCHAVEVHRFAPLDRTCAQAGCHTQSTIAIGSMRGQTALHCTMCHRFTAEVPALATRDSAAGTLVPGAGQCFSCHAMRARVVGLDPLQDPHGGTCGMCHKPHQQEGPAEARRSCTNAGCHDNWRAEPFHVGLQHGKVGTQCTLCHQPHRASVDASDCAGCHTAVRERARGRIRPPLPFDTTRVRGGVSWRHPPRDDLSAPDAVPKGKGDIPPPVALPRPGAQAAPPDTFSHDRHRRLPCITCHTPAGGHGRLTFQPPRGCQICHHQAPATNTCSTCHAEAPDPTLRVRVEVAVAARAPREREVAFSHEVHTELRCVACHDTPVTLTPSLPAAGCTACHDAHHAAARDCAACHVQNVEIRTAHAPPTNAHVACDACHSSRTVARLLPDRSFCLGCHAAERDHHPERPCTVCHLQMTPDEFRERLRKTGDDER